ncbi:MAG TPA: transcriptional repressor [Vicinamibacteria bacterium]|nr:transcriptional repressor [Vicinamibacteria bacterium]
MRRTVQRMVVLEAVCASMDHPTAEEVFQAARQRLPHISLGTVYRNLRDLAGEGAIREIHAGGQPVRFDGNVTPHHHVRCVHCGRMADLPATSPARRAEESAARALNFRVLGHHVEVLGVCPPCHAGEDASRRSRPHASQEDLRS